MRQRLKRRDSFTRIENKHSLNQIFESLELAHLLGGLRRRVDQQNVPKQVRFADIGNQLLANHHVSTGLFVLVRVELQKVLVKVFVRVLSSSQKLLWDLSAKLHEQLEHVVVVSALEEHFSGEKLHQAAAQTPHVDLRVEMVPEDDLRRTIVQRPVLGVEHVERRVGPFDQTRSEIAQFHKIELGTHQNVVQLHVGVDESHAVEIVKRNAQLSSVLFASDQTDSVWDSSEKVSQVFMHRLHD